MKHSWYQLNLSYDPHNSAPRKYNILESTAVITITTERQRIMRNICIRKISTNKELVSPLQKHKGRLPNLYSLGTDTPGSWWE